MENLSAKGTCEDEDINDDSNGESIKEKINNSQIRRISDIDDCDSTLFPQISENINVEKRSVKYKKCNIINSDSEGESSLSNKNINKIEPVYNIDNNEIDRDDNCDSKLLQQISENTNVERRPIKYKRFNIIDSDSEEESALSNKNINKIDPVYDTDNKEILIPENKDICEIIVDRDDGRDGTFQQSENMNVEKGPRKYKKFNIIDSDSEEESALSNQNINEIEPVYNINNKGILIPENKNKSCLLAICDPDTSDDESNNDYGTDNSYETKYGTKTKSENKMLKARSIDLPQKKITGRDALKLRQEIQSESQRRTRESAIHLPYHRPKTRTLKEFLENRTRFASAVPIFTCNTSPSLAIKMTTKQLKVISEKLSEREKEVEQFFKSESESEEEVGPPEEPVPKSQDSNKKEETNNSECNTKLNKSEHNFLNSKEDLSPTETENVLKTDTNQMKTNLNLLELPETSSVVILQNILLSPSANVNNAHSVITNNTDPSNNVPHNDSNAIAIKQTNLGTDSESKKQDTQTNSKEDDENDPQYKFSIDKECFGDEESQNIDNQETDKLNKLIEKYTSVEFINETDVVTNTENYSDIGQTENKSVLELVKHKWGNVKPELKGNPNLVIDLEEGTTKLNEVNELMSRFWKHAKRKTPQKQKVKLDIVSVSNGEIHKETVEVPMIEEGTISINEKPGERLKKLREELQEQIAQRRSQLWQQKSHLKVKGDEIEQEDSPMEVDNILEDEEEFTNSEDEEDEENDYEMKEIKKLQKSVFVDDEAAESERSDNDENSVNVSGDEANEQSCVEEDTDDEDEQPLTNDLGTPKKKKLKRIIKPFSNESEDEESSIDNIPESKCDDVLKLDNLEKNEYVLDSTDTWDECSGPTPHQRRNPCTPTRKQTQSKTELGFLTPVVQLTGLQSLNSGSKFLHDSPISPFILPSGSSPIKSFTQTGAQKKLFDDPDLATTQELSEVAALCSGTFSSQTQEVEGENQLKHSSGGALVTSITSDSDNHTTNENAYSNQRDPTTQELLEICSGKFTGFTQIKEIPNQEEGKYDIHFINGMSDSSKPSSNLTEISLNNNEIKNLDTEDKLISQLLDEEEMESFKKKFDSPLDTHTTSSGAPGRIIYDSSDDEQGSPCKVKKKQRKLVFSDDEDSSDDEEDNFINDNEEIELCDEDENVSLPRDVEYDSEENELEVNNTERSHKMKIADFLENEAELSESEWGSEDEDERGLDQFELEEGDTEKLDDEKVKRDLERIHMRRVLDDDNHEIKILQELLLNDGELHGSGRARQFRWKNIDSIGDDMDTLPRDDGEIYIDEDGDEEKWRKMRYERELYLKKQLERSQSLSTEEDELPVKTNSQFLKLGQAAIKRCPPNTQNNTITQENKLPLSSPELKETTSILSKRGSFLARSDQVLARVAEFTKTVTSVIGTAKNSKKIIFQTVSESTEEITMNGKRKAADGTPNAIKKLRLNNLSPAMQKREKQENSKVKHLFSVW